MSNSFLGFNKQAFFDLVKFILITLIIVIPIRTWVAQPFVVSGASMLPTFDHGQYLIIDELTYNFRSPKRGEVVVFRYPKEPNKFFIKRIIGLPEETIEIIDGEVTIIDSDNNTTILNEPYIKSSGGPEIIAELNEKEYFVLGDNRSLSLDSRVWGPVAEDMISGKVIIRLLPPNEISWRPGNFKNY